MGEMFRVAKPGATVILVTWCHRPLKEGEKLAPSEQARAASGRGPVRDGLWRDAGLGGDMKHTTREKHRVVLHAPLTGCD